MAPPPERLADTAAKRDEEKELTVLTREFTEQEILEIKDAFAMFDIDGGGTIEASELKSVLSQLGNEPTDQEVEEMILMVDGKWR
jgi:Ca2+-binding EF-hand superfamily protein